MPLYFLIFSFSRAQPTFALWADEDDRSVSVHGSQRGHQGFVSRHRAKLLQGCPGRLHLLLRLRKNARATLSGNGLKRRTKTDRFELIIRSEKCLYSLYLPIEVSSLFRFRHCTGPEKTANIPRKLIGLRKRIYWEVSPLFREMAVPYFGAVS